MSGCVARAAPNPSQGTANDSAPDPCGLFHSNVSPEEPSGSQTGNGTAQGTSPSRPTVCDDRGTPCPKEAYQTRSRSHKVAASREPYTENYKETSLRGEVRRACAGLRGTAGKERKEQRQRRDMVLGVLRSLLSRLHPGQPPPAGPAQGPPSSRHSCPPAGCPPGPRDSACGHQGHGC